MAGKLARKRGGVVLTWFRICVSIAADHRDKDEWVGVAALNSSDKFSPISLWQMESVHQKGQFPEHQPHFSGECSYPRWAL